MFQRTLDLSNPKDVEGAFEGIDVLIHLAALVDVSPFGQDWDAMKAANFDATFYVFRECARAKVRRVIFASTNHVQVLLSFFCCHF